MKERHYSLETKYFDGLRNASKMFHKEAPLTESENQDTANEPENYLGALNSDVPLMESLDQYRLFVKPEDRDVSRLEGQYLEDF